MIFNISFLLFSLYMFVAFFYLKKSDSTSSSCECPEQRESVSLLLGGCDMVEWKKNCSKGCQSVKNI